MSAFLVHYCFHPRGGWWETVLWAVALVALASQLDLVLYEYSDKVDWLRIIWC